MNAEVLLPRPERTRHWRTLKHPTQAPRPLHRWLTDDSSLTRLLQRASQGRFSVRVLSQRYAHPGANEAVALGMGVRRTALIREVLLCGNGVPWVYARTVIPVDTLRGRHRTLKMIGSRSLGSLLFKDPGMQRDPLQIARVLDDSGHRYWARRSIFHLDRKPLLVCEVFLPPLLDVQYPA
ncbi:Chorismate--pyruvate lyase [Marinobacterium lacunae]|uniref:Probable chorismate pyruvate-lyase n=1 Tax=Marinobacterium lacunae TaxID=1232683 RepID=A0A081FV66_9GAMM|nr:chorismate lyase [Marinobacterium lacunae]KEA62421.1 Chorismate--pyruvate lyase [Marinobacterium lacunae]MBR9884436.1 chorismate lyase [Oceanospirillales bacterium]